MHWNPEEAVNETFSSYQISLFVLRCAVALSSLVAFEEGLFLSVLPREGGRDGWKSMDKSVIKQDRIMLAHRKSFAFGQF